MKIEVSLVSPHPQADLVLCPSENLVTGSKEFIKTFGVPSSLEEDLILFASSVMASDLALKRGERENIARDFTLQIPVINEQLFRPLKSRIENLLYLLSNDNWTIVFKQRGGISEPTKVWKSNGGKVLLFSGGLDSFSAAVEELNAGTDLILVSHITHNRITKTSQEDLQKLLANKFVNSSRLSFLISGRKTKILDFPTDINREESQRTRSFLFMAIGALVARRTGHHDVLMIAENGQMAIHLPLTAARIGAFSTHTAHPEVVAELQDILRSLLGFNLKISNPFLYMTKAEVVSTAVKLFGKKLIASTSCWRGSRIGGGMKHCGVCVPCLVRRIALEKNGLLLNEYDRDIFAETIDVLPDNDLGKRNLVELLEFVEYFSGRHSDAIIESAYPELTNPFIDKASAILMYKRFSKEAKTVMSKYPNIKRLL